MADRPHCCDQCKACREKNRPDKCAKAAAMMRQRSLSLEHLNWEATEPSNGGCNGSFNGSYGGSQSRPTSASMQPPGKQPQDEELIYEKLPVDIAQRHVLLLDPVLATGTSAARAVQARPFDSCQGPLCLASRVLGGGTLAWGGGACAWVLSLGWHWLRHCPEGQPMARCCQEGDSELVPGLALKLLHMWMEAAVGLALADPPSSCHSTACAARWQPQTCDL